MSIFTQLMEKLFGKKSPPEREKDTYTDGDSYHKLKQDVLNSSKLLIACVPQAGPACGQATASRFGGSPAWPPGEPGFIGQNGKAMIFLAQINFEETPPLEGFPEKGLLQFFVEDSDINGCEFPSANGRGYSVIYRENTDGLVLGNQYQERLPEFSPFQTTSVMSAGRDLVFELGKMHPTYADVSVSLRDSALFKSGDKKGSEEFYDWMDEFDGPEIYFGGFPKFTQNDIRDQSQWRDYNIVLLQLGVTDEMMWGDSGEACFLIRKKDLIEKRFENAIYNWDCC